MISKVECRLKMKLVEKTVSVMILTGSLKIEKSEMSIESGDIRSRNIYHFFSTPLRDRESDHDSLFQYKASKKEPDLSC